jgi:hemerythrin-like domain-containing protein
MHPAELRERVLDDHENLRIRLAMIESLSQRADEGEVDALDQLRDRGDELCRKLGRHLDLEDLHLVPLILETRGREAARQLADEHREQRLLFDFVLARLRDARRPTRLVCREIQAFIDLLRDDMDMEEQELLYAAEFQASLPGEGSPA